MYNVKFFSYFRLHSTFGYAPIRQSKTENNKQFLPQFLLPFLVGGEALQRSMVQRAQYMVNIMNFRPENIVFIDQTGSVSFNE